MPETDPFADLYPKGAPSVRAPLAGAADPFADLYPAPEEEMGEFAKGVGGGVDFFQSTMGVLGIAMGRVFGSEDMEAYGEELRSRNVEEGKQYVPKVGRVEDIRSISDGFDYASFTLGHLLPSIGASVVGGAVGTIAGGAMGLAPGAVIGGLAGAFAPSLLLNGGEVYNDLREKGVDSFSAAATAGIPMALLDMFVPGRVAGKLVWKPSKKALTTAKKAAKPPRKFGKRLRQETGRTALVESGTEALQETIALAVETDVTGEKFVTNENMSRILNASVAGLIGGVAVGPLAAVRGDPTPIEAATEEELADAASGGGEPPGGGAAAPVAEAGVDPATGLPIVPEPTDETTAQPAQTGLTGQAAQSPVEPGPQPPGPPGTPVPVQEEVVEAPDVATAPAEAAVEPTPVSEVVAPGPTEIAPQPAETAPAVSEEPDDALGRVQAVLKGKMRALATKKQQADVAKILGVHIEDTKVIDDTLDAIGYVPEVVAKKPSAAPAPAPAEKVMETEEGWEKATTRATEFVRAKDGGKVTASMLAKRFKLNKAQAERLHGHLRSQGTLTQKGYAHKKITKPRDVLDIIKEMGGIKPTGELRTMDLQKARPGIMRNEGRSTSEVREHLEELGMVAIGSKDSVVYDEMDRAIRKEEGRPFHPEDEDLVVKIQGEEAEDQNQRALDDARAVIEDSGIDLSKDETKQVMDRVRNGENTEDAMEAVLVLTADQEALDETSAEEDIPFDGTGETETQPSKEGEAAPRKGKPASRPARAKEKDVEDGTELPEAGQVQGKKDLRDKEIGADIGAEERKKPRDTEREKAEVKARSLPTKIRSAKEQKEADEGLFKETTTPLEEAIAKPKVTPQVAAMPGMAPLGIEPTKQDMVKQAKADLDAMEAAAPTTEEDIPDIPDFLKRKTGDREVAPVVEEPVPIVTKAAKARRKKRKTPEQITRLRQLGYPNAAIGRLTEAEATVTIAKSRKYVKEAKKKQPAVPPVAEREEQAKEAAPSPADLEGIEIEYPVTVEETQETVTVKAKAATALKNVDTRIAALTDLAKCLK